MLFDHKRAKGQEGSNDEEGRAYQRPAVPVPGQDDSPGVGNKKNAMGPAGPFDEHGEAGEVFEGHGEANEDEKRDSLEAANEAEGRGFRGHVGV